MAYNEKLAIRLRQALAHVANVVEKKMFGGLAFIVNGKMCINIGADRIMCRIDPSVHDEAISRDGVTTVNMNSRDYKGYVNVHEDVIKTKNQLNHWVELALNFNDRARSSKKH